jgi:hypothetical protein
MYLGCGKTYLYQQNNLEKKAEQIFLKILLPALDRGKQISTSRRRTHNSSHNSRSVLAEVNF